MDVKTVEFTPFQDQKPGTYVTAIATLYKTNLYCIC